MKDDLKKSHLDRNLAKDRDRWRAQIMGKTSDLREHEKRDVKLEERERTHRDYSYLILLVRAIRLNNL